MCRHELKFVLRNADAPSVLEWLRARCRPETPHSAGRVSTIYFDTPSWRFLRDKVDSDYVKTKVRVRWYADLDGGRPAVESFVEVKRKIGGRREKVRVRTDVPGAWLAEVDLDAPALASLPETLRPHAAGLPEPLWPTFQVRYRRHRFVEPLSGARVNLDHDIEAPAVSRRMVPRPRPCGRLPQAVFEVKGDRSTLPALLRELTALGGRKCSFSKYGECHRILTGRHHRE